MSNKNEPAFPGKRVNGVFTESFEGLTKREYFAAMAMTGLVAYSFSTDSREASALAVRHADALIAELEKNNTVD